MAAGRPSIALSYKMRLAIAEELVRLAQGSRFFRTSETPVIRPLI